MQDRWQASVLEAGGEAAAALGPFPPITIGVRSDDDGACLALSHAWQCCNAPGHTLSLVLQQRPDPSAIVRGVEERLHDNDPAWRLVPSLLPSALEVGPNTVRAEMVELVNSGDVATLRAMIGECCRPTSDVASFPS